MKRNVFDNNNNNNNNIMGAEAGYRVVVDYDADAAMAGLKGVRYIAALLLVWGMLVTSCSGVAWAQKQVMVRGKDKLQVKSPLQGTPVYVLAVGCNKTCMLVFPAAIQSADRGAAYVLAERVAGAENVLKVKAGKADFLPSSLTVITKDGQIFAFNVHYSANPPSLVINLQSRAPQFSQSWLPQHFEHSKVERPVLTAGTTARPPIEMGLPGDTAGKAGVNGPKSIAGGGVANPVDFSATGPLAISGGPVRFSGLRLNSLEMENALQRVLRTEDFIRGAHSHKYGLVFKLTGIFYNKDLLFFKFRLHNTAGIPYHIGSVRFFVRDKKTAKRTAIADNELKPVVIRSIGLSESDKGNEIVVVLPRFTIADNKRVAVELMEAEGDRVLRLYIRQNKMDQIRLM